MAPLSRPLSGLILPHDYYGNHLDADGKTIDEDLEKRNFEKAGATLAEVWSEVIFDGYPCVAEYVQPDHSEFSQVSLLVKNQHWFAEHVRTSQYMTQIVKCKSSTCCSEHRSSYFSIVPARFIPPPIPLVQSNLGLRACNLSDFETNKFPSLFFSLSISRDILPPSVEQFRILPYDLYTPSIQSQLSDRICTNCDLYFASKVMLKSHMIVHKKKSNPSVNKGVQEKEIIHTRTRPVRIAAMRQREIMAIIASDENDGSDTEDAEWIDRDDLDLSGVPSAIVDNSPALICPVIPLNEHFSNPWENE